MRIPVISPSDYTPQQKDLAQHLKGGVTALLSSFVTSRDDGAFIGPFNLMLRFPALGKVVYEYFSTLHHNSKLSAQLHEMVILLTGAHFGCMYELYSHESTATANKTLSEAKISTFAAGQRPVDLTQEEAIAFDIASVLLGGTQIPQSTYNRGVKAFGEEGVSEIVYLIGCYTTICLLLNAFDVSLPGTELGYDPPSKKR